MVAYTQHDIQMKYYIIDLLSKFTSPALVPLQTNTHSHTDLGIKTFIYYPLWHRNTIMDYYYFTTTGCLLLKFIEGGESMCTF